MQGNATATATHLRADSGEGNHGAGLLVCQLAEAGLVLDDDEGDLHLAAQGGQPHNQLCGVEAERRVAWGKG